MIEKIKFKHLYDNIYSHYVDVYDGNQLIDKLYLEFNYYKTNNSYHYIYDYTINYMIEKYSIYDYIFSDEIYFYEQNSVVYNGTEYHILTNLIVHDKQVYMNKIRISKLKTLC